MHNGMVGSTDKRIEKSHQGRMDKVTIMNVEEADRLSSLPDDLIHMILSLVSLKEVIRTCVLSSRWRFIWTSMPCLSFSSNQDDEIGVVALSSFKATTTPTWDLVLALTTLHLNSIILSDDNFTGLFSKCPNLKHLSFRSCQIAWNGSRNVMNISHPRLSDLTLDHSLVKVESLNVVAPQLKNLTIINIKMAASHAKQYLISAPGLTSLVIKSGLLLHVIPTQGFPSLEIADLCVRSPGFADDACKIVCLLQHLHNVKFLTLNLEILELLASSMEPISPHDQPCPFANINILKFLEAGYRPSVYMEVQPHENVTAIKNNLQDSFPRAILTMISREAIRGMRDILSARILIAATLRLIKEHNLWSSFKHQEMHTLYLRQIEEQVLTKLQLFEGLLTGLPAVSKSLPMQAIYSRVCKEADFVKKNMLECIKIQYNNNNKMTQQQILSC